MQKKKAEARIQKQRIGSFLLAADFGLPASDFCIQDWILWRELDTMSSRFAAFFAP
jgi:hypothetical protein